MEHKHKHTQNKPEKFCEMTNIFFMGIKLRCFGLSYTFKELQIQECKNIP